MNGVHDMGGMHCFGEVDLDDEDTLFHEKWEKQVLALTLAMGATGTWNIDQSRSARESLPAPFYLSAGYYRIWLAALENLLVHHALVDPAELQSGVCTTPAATVQRVLLADDVRAALAAGSSSVRETSSQPQFDVGAEVVVRNLHKASHTRLPAYIRQRRGRVARVHGCHVFADDSSQGKPDQSQWLYNVRFENTELWGEQAQHGFVHVDCWESYLEPAT